MISGGKRKFKNPEIVKEMIELRNSGTSWDVLARRYNCDRTSVMYQYQKNIGLGKIFSNKNKYKKGERKIQKFRKGHCPQCDMLLTSKYHMEKPCKI